MQVQIEESQVERENNIAWGKLFDRTLKSEVESAEKELSPEQKTYGKK